MQESALQLQADKLATKKSLVNAKSELIAAETAYPLVSINIINAENKIANLEAGIKSLTAIAKRLKLNHEDVSS